MQAFFIQGNPRRNVNILGSGSIGHCGKKISHEHVFNSELLQR